MAGGVRAVAHHAELLAATIRLLNKWTYTLFKMPDRLGLKWAIRCAITPLVGSSVNLIGLPKPI
jgi:hypothetical protein